MMSSNNAFALAAFAGLLAVLHILRPLISDDRLLNLIHESLPIASIQQHKDVVIYLITLTKELPNNPKIDFVSISNFLSILLRNKNLSQETKNNYLWIQNFLWSSLLNGIGTSTTPSHLGQLPPELHFHLAKFISAGKFSAK